MASSMNHRRRSPHSHPLNMLTTANLMTMKGATFHSPSSPSCDDAFPSPPASPTEGFMPPRFTRAQSDPDDVIDASRRRAAAYLSKLDKNLSSLVEMLSPTDSPVGLGLDIDMDAEEVLPVPVSFLGFDKMSRETLMQDRVSGSRRARQPQSSKPKHNHASDSGLGTSLVSSKEQQAPESPTCPDTASVITRFAAATMGNVPGLSQRAANRIQEHILRPLRAKDSLKEFEQIVMDVPRCIREKQIVCLRDLEKTLWFKAQEKTKSSSLYLDFCLTSIRCIQATAEYLSEREQVRPGDRPYTNGYFIDLKDQLFQYAAQLAGMKDEESKVNPVDNIDLVDILSYEPATPLARVKKDGRVLSLVTGPESVVDDSASDTPLIRLKRSLSAGVEDDEEILRSMARRKKNAPIEELIPKKCPVLGCNKEFKRPCDLTKHEKTHLRPFKCKLENCKYYKLGWPTEKELDRHWNDKHSANPSMYRCNYHPCPYKSKRESNCKQHMEKAHGWVYVRQKTNGKKSSNGSVYGGNAAPHQSLSPIDHSSYGAPTPPREDHLRAHYNAFEYPVYPADQDYMQVQGPIPHQLDDMDFEIATAPRQPPQPFVAYSNNTFPNNSNYMVHHEEMYSSPPHHLPSPDPMNFSHKDIVRGQVPAFESQRPSMMQPPQTHSAPYTPPQNHQASFSPGAESSTMLYTPTSMQDEDLGFGDASYKGAQMSGDFPLFPVDVKTTQAADILFAHMPGPILPFSSQPSQDLFPAMVDPLQSAHNPFGWQPQPTHHVQQQQQHVHHHHHHQPSHYQQSYRR